MSITVVVISQIVVVFSVIFWAFRTRSLGVGVGQVNATTLSIAQNLSRLPKLIEVERAKQIDELQAKVVKLNEIREWIELPVNFEYYIEDALRWCSAKVLYNPKTGEMRGAFGKRTFHRDLDGKWGGLFKPSELRVQYTKVKDDDCRLIIAGEVYEYGDKTFSMIRTV